MHFRGYIGFLMNAFPGLNRFFKKFISRVEEVL